MKVYKFGGASTRDAAGIRNVGTLLRQEADNDLVVVVSAMGKTTNALEAVVVSYMAGRTDEALQRWHLIRDGHTQLLAELAIHEQAPLRDLFQAMTDQLAAPVSALDTSSYDVVYDRIVSVGELMASRILTAYFTQLGLPVAWADARQLVRTDATFREGHVDWPATRQLIEQLMTSQAGLVITQGFIGGTADRQTTTLGREGSDYSAAIFAYCLNAESVTIWKDVPGVLNADPRYFDETLLLPELTYQDATELAYYGATVIHPKTIKPLQNKGIPLFVKSFLNPIQAGTMISTRPVARTVPSFIFKVDQLLISLYPTDFSFIAEENLSLIFGLFAGAGVKINLMQNTALSFSVVVDNRPDRMADLLDQLRANFRVAYNDGLELITIRHYNKATLDRVLTGKRLLLEQRSRTTAQLVVRDDS